MRLLKTILKIIIATLGGYLINRLEFILYTIGEQIYYKILFPDTCKYKRDIWLLYTMMLTFNIVFCNTYIFKKNRKLLLWIYLLFVVIFYLFIILI